VSNQPVAASLRGVILDMDGVLVDSEPFMKEAATRMFAERGVTVSADDFDPYIGTGETRILKGVAEKYGIPVDVERDKARTYAIYLALIPGRLRPLPGVYDFIAECRRRCLKLAVASSADDVKVRGNLHELHLEATAFDALVNGSQVERKKPAPDIFLAAAARLGLAPTECLVVEDAVAGVAAAKAAGSRCLALTTSFPADRLTAADWIAPNLAHCPPEVFTGAPPPTGIS
jgi:HAD superfamily hydrolase (TIGR01509 family)